MKKNIILFIKNRAKRSSRTVVYFTISIVYFVVFAGAVNVYGALNKNISKADSTSGGTVAPLAHFKKNADEWFKKINVTKEQWLSKLPTKSQLGAPVYPGAVIVVYQPAFHSDQENLLSELIIVTPDPVNKVESWYSAKLKGWEHDKAYHVFFPPKMKVDVMSDKFKATHHVEIEKIFTKHQMDGMFLKQPDNAKTAIIFRY